MPTLRGLIDKKQINAESNDSLFKSLGKVAKSKADYDTQKMKLHSKLAPARTMLQMIDQAHSIQPGGDPNDPFSNPMQQTGGPGPGGVGQGAENQDDLARTGNMKRSMAPGQSRDTKPLPKPGGEDDEDYTNKSKQKIPVGNKNNKPGAKKPEKSKKGDERHVKIEVKGGGPGSGRRSEGGSPKYPVQRTAGRPLGDELPVKKSSMTDRWRQKAGLPKLSAKSMKGKRIKADYHDNEGYMSPTRAVGLAAQRLQKKLKANISGLEPSDTNVFPLTRMKGKKMKACMTEPLAKK